MDYQNKVKNRTSKMELTYNCQDCGAPLATTLGEILFYDDKDLIVPKRCKGCIDEKNKRFVVAE